MTHRRFTVTEVAKRYGVAADVLLRPSIGASALVKPVPRAGGFVASYEVPAGVLKPSLQEMACQALRLGGPDVQMGMASRPSGPSGQQTDYVVAVRKSLKNSSAWLECVKRAVASLDAEVYFTDGEA